MNLSITNVCSRRCEYCFQKDWYLAKSVDTIQEMSLENIERIINFAGNEYINILGGEPLLHSKLEEIICLFKRYKIPIRILSNFNVPDDKLKILLNHIDDIGLLSVNCDYTDSQKNQFTANVKKIPASYEKLILSTTLMPGAENIEKSVTQLLDTIAILNNKNSLFIRVAPMTPNSHLRYDSSCMIEDDVLYVIRKIQTIYPHAIFSLDCPYSNCEISPETTEYFRENMVGINPVACHKTNFPLDILVDNSALWCFSAHFIKVDNIFDYQNITALTQTLRDLCTKYRNQHFSKTKCAHCEQYNKTCSGICVAKMI